MVKVYSLHISPAELESTKCNWSPRKCKTIQCLGLNESIINMLIIHLKLIKANLQIKVLQANKKEKSGLMMLCGGYLYNYTLHQQIALKLHMTLSIH